MFLFRSSLKIKMNKEEEGYDSEDDVSIRSLFSSIGSVDDEYHFNDNSLGERNNHKSKKIFNKNELDFNSKSMFNFSVKQDFSKSVKLPNILQNRRKVKLDNHIPNIFNSTPQNKTIMFNPNTSQHNQLGLIQKVIYTNPQNRFIIAVPSTSSFDSKKTGVYMKKINTPRLVPIMYNQNNNTSPVKIIHHHHFIKVKKNKITKSKENLHVENNKNGSTIHNNISNNNVRHFIETEFFRSSPSIDYYEASQHFSYNEDIGKTSFFKKFN
jgi:hypothetical protein